MMIDLLIDTNVWIYAMDKSSAYRESAETILTDPNYNLFITSKNISEFFVVTSKHKIDHQISLDFFYEIKAYSKILFPSISSVLLFEKLIQQYHPKGNNVFDIEIVSIMLDNGISHIATFNRKDFAGIAEVQPIEP